MASLSGASSSEFENLSEDEGRGTDESSYEFNFNLQQNLSNTSQLQCTPRGKQKRSRGHVESDASENVSLLNSSKKKKRVGLTSFHFILLLCVYL